MADQNIKVNINLDLTEFNKNAKAMSDALSKVLGKDVKMFADDMKKAEASINGAEKAMKGASAAASKAGGEVKQGNKQWTNFALIIQDLPYGFRGIQNNLPAVIGGFAGMTGPIYLATSAIIAFFTAWDAGFFKTKNATSALTEANKEYAESLKSSMGSAGEEISKMNALVKIAKDQEESMSKRLLAVKKLQDEYPSYFGNLSKEQILNGNIKTAVDGVKTAILERAKATAVAGKINKLSAEKFAKEEELYQLALIKTARIKRALAAAAATKVPEEKIPALLQLVVKDVREQENVIQTSVDRIDTELKRLEGIYGKTTATSLELEQDPFKEAPKPKVSTKALDALKSQAKLYEDDLFTRRYYNLLILDEEEKVALKQAEIDKLSKDELAFIAQDFKNKRLLIEKQTQDSIAQIRSKGVENQAKFEEEEFNKVKESYDKQLTVFDEFYKNKHNLSTGNRLQQKLTYEQEASDLQYMLENNLISYQDYINRLGVVFKGWTNNNKALATETANYIQQIGVGMMNALGPALDMLLEKGASISDVLSRAFSDLIKKLAKVAIAAAIVVTLLAIAGIVDWSEFGKTFGKLAASGMGLNPNLLSAGPSTTPGQSNDISDATASSAMENSTLVAQVSGNDLLVLLNRTSRNNNNTF